MNCPITWEEAAERAEFRPEALATLCGASYRTIQRHFKRNYGTDVGRWLQVYRLALAYVRIYSGESITKVSQDLKFTALSNFSRAFKQRYGISPSVLKKQSVRRGVQGKAAGNTSGVDAGWMRGTHESLPKSGDIA